MSLHVYSPHPTTRSGRWAGWWREVGFRFGLIYLSLHNLGAGLELVPGLSGAAERLQLAQKQAAAWVGHHVFGIVREIPVGVTGSSDTTADWIRVAVFGVGAALGALIWSLMDRRSEPDGRLRGGLRVGLRYVLGGAMLLYGCMKVIPPTQFPAPSLAQLSQALGEASPQGLLWRFLGFSPAYVTALGVVEIVAGALLFFRRTTLLGALLTAGIMANVVGFNLCYDVPVKLYSSHLLVMALVLILPDIRRLAAMFFLNRAVERADDAVPWNTVRARRLVWGLKILFLVGALNNSVGAQLRARAANAENFGFTPPELRGIWSVETFTRDGRLVPPLATDNSRWRTVIFGDYRSVLMRRMDGQRGGFWFVSRATQPGAFLFEQPGSKGSPTPVTITLPEAGAMQLTTTLNGAALQVTLRRVDESKFTLLSRGFHWITETSYNR